MAFSKIREVGIEKHLIEWIPHEVNEDIVSYAKRIIQMHNISSFDMVAGLSFGGLVAQVIAELLHLPEVILISSFRNKNDLKFYFNWGLSSKLYRLMPPLRIPVIDKLVAQQLNSGTHESVPVLSKMLQSTDYSLMKWSLS